MHKLTSERANQAFSELENIDAELEQLWDTFARTPKDQLKEQLTAFHAYLKRLLEGHQLFNEVSLGRFITNINDQFLTLHCKCTLLKSDLSRQFSMLPELPDSNTCPLSGLTGMLAWMENLLQTWDSLRAGGSHGVVFQVENPVPTHKKSKDLNWQVARELQVNPYLDADRIGKILRVNGSSVRNTQSWKNRRIFQQNGKASERVGFKDLEGTFECFADETVDDENQ